LRFEDGEHLALCLPFHDHQRRRKAAIVFAWCSGPAVHLEHSGHRQYAGLACSAHAHDRAVRQRSRIENGVVWHGGIVSLPL
jgi:hypothetical protein